MQQNPSYLHPEINRMLQQFTKYVSKPLGFNKMYKDVNKRGKSLHFSFKCSQYYKYLTINAIKLEIEYASSLPLQIALFFNVFYSFCWIIGTSFLWPVLVI